MPYKPCRPLSPTQFLYLTADRTARGMDTGRSSQPDVAISTIPVIQTIRRSDETQSSPLDGLIQEGDTSRYWSCFDRLCRPAACMEQVPLPEGAGDRAPHPVPLTGGSAPAASSCIPRGPFDTPWTSFGFDSRRDHCRYSDVRNCYLRTSGRHVLRPSVVGLLHGTITKGGGGKESDPRPLLR